MSLDRKINRIQFLSGNSLKVIAVLTMLIDHLCKIVLQWLLSNYWGAMADNGQMSWERFREIDYFIRFDLQSIGTIAFPLRSHAGGSAGHAHHEQPAGCNEVPAGAEAGKLF